MGKAMRPVSRLVLDRNGNMGGKGGTFVYFMEEHLDIKCNMKFDDYPMDEHVCYFRIFSPTYKQDELVIKIIKD